jgi:glycosyltransferase involved in cell wall biosynthesis
MSLDSLRANGSASRPPLPEPGELRPRRAARVLFINDTARNGGPGRSLFYILKFLDPAVVHRAVVLPRPGVISELYAEAGITDELFFEPNLVENPVEPWHRAIEREDFDAPLPLRALRLLGNLGRGAWSIAKLTSLVKRGRYDLVYCNGTNACFAGGALARTAARPALWHVRYTSVPRALAGVHARLAAGRNVARIVCVSQASASLFPHCAHKVKVIHNALDVEEFAPSGARACLRAELGLGEGTVVFGSQGRILPRKGYREMVRAAKMALEQMTPEERARVHFAVLGDTPADMRPDHLAECRALVAELGISSAFTFLGFRVDVKPYVADFDVAVVPSVYPDPLPRAVIESMALGKPVIAFDVGGVAEMLRDGHTGALVRGAPPDVAGLAAQLLRYLRDGELRVRHGLAARARIEKDFDSRTQARRIQDEILAAAGLAVRGRE